MMQAVIERVLDNLRNYSMLRFGAGRLGVFRTTGPIAYTRAITPLLSRHPHSIFDSEDCGLIYSILATESGKSGHKKLFRPHYSKAIMPIMSSGPETAWHRLYHRLVHTLRQR